MIEYFQPTKGFPALCNLQKRLIKKLNFFSPWTFVRWVFSPFLLKKVALQIEHDLSLFPHELSLNCLLNPNFPMKLASHFFPFNFFLYPHFQRVFPSLVSLPVVLQNMFFDESAFLICIWLLSCKIRI